VVSVTLELLAFKCIINTKGFILLPLTAQLTAFCQSSITRSSHHFSRIYQKTSSNVRFFLKYFLQNSIYHHRVLHW